MSVEFDKSWLQRARECAAKILLKYETEIARGKREGIDDILAAIAMSAYLQGVHDQYIDHQGAILANAEEFWDGLEGR